MSKKTTATPTTAAPEVKKTGQPKKFDHSVKPQAAPRDGGTYSVEEAETSVGATHDALNNEAS